MWQFLKLCFFLVGGYFLAGGCQKAELLPTSVNNFKLFIGHWQNFNVHQDELFRIIILRPESNQLSIQLWDICDAVPCKRGSQVLNIETGAVSI